MLQVKIGYIVYTSSSDDDDDIELFLLSSLDLQSVIHKIKVKS